MKKPQLYLLPVPLSETDIQTIPEYNRQIMSNIRYFIVERVRTARRFLRKLAPDVVIDELTFFELNKRTTPEELSEMLAPIWQGYDVGLMSEAGCPGVADPGALIVEMAHESGIVVHPLVGPSSILLALMGSGMNGQSFSFHGYLPAKKEQLVPALRKLEQVSGQTGGAQLFIETPYRNQQVFAQAMACLSAKTKLTIAADLTTESQYIVTKSIGQWKQAPPPALHKRPVVFVLQAH
ncbi:MAG TPA: SAM-dependent methyltransferase [Saprospiraceae bacterium]|nr:SAM-dependent methyltransferase [Saprospiraceae bacterium]